LDHAARVGTVGYAGVVLTQLLGVLLLDERPGWGQVVGTSLVIASGVLLALTALRYSRRA
jgi:drug/metabolite transporter (DMT)-like permease